MKRFVVPFDQHAQDDLRERLRRTRLVPAAAGGIGSDTLRDFISQWLEFDWAAEVRELNALPHGLTEVEGQAIHFVHVRRSAPKTPPILLLHGWPGSFLEFLDVIPLLPDSDLVIASLPGYAWSAPLLPGTSNRRIAVLLAGLMAKLGYTGYIAQGGDWGAGVATWLALLDPNLRAIHLNYIPGSYAPHVDQRPTAEEDDFLRSAKEWSEKDGAYGHVQRTRPQTLAHALHDSPAGLAAWILEKFVEWADPASGISTRALLGNITLYWMTGTIGSSMQLYRESVATPLRLKQRIATPCAIARFPLEMPFPPRSWIERGYNVVRWTDMPVGGHFAALEQPKLLADDIRAFAATSSRA